MAQKQRIILVEDEEDIAALVKMQGELAGYHMHVETDGTQGYHAIEKQKPDLVILDIMLPGQTGLDICRKMKSDASLQSIPIVILSAKGEELDIILGLELGADDYVAKPFSPKILFSRIKAVLRRKSEPAKSAEIVRFGEFTLDVSQYLLKRGDKNIPLTLSEFGILKRLLLNKGKVLSRNQLLEGADSSGDFIVDRNIDVHIAALRKKLGPGFDWIETVRGVGYRFKESS